MSDELARREADWRTHRVGQLYDRCQSIPPVVRMEIWSEYIRELEAEKDALKQQANT